MEVATFGSSEAATPPHKELSISTICGATSRNRGVQLHGLEPTLLTAAAMLALLFF